MGGDVAIYPLSGLIIGLKIPANDLGLRYRGLEVLRLQGLVQSRNSTEVESLRSRQPRRSNR